MTNKTIENDTGFYYVLALWKFMALVLKFYSLWNFKTVQGRIILAKAVCKILRKKKNMISNLNTIKDLREILIS